MKLKELKEKGFVKNPNLWLGDGQLYCTECKRYTLHEAYTLPETSGLRTDVEVCTRCDSVPDHRMPKSWMFFDTTINKDKKAKE